MFDWPLAAVAVSLERSADGTCRGASVILGTVAPTPYRARATERAIIGHRIDAGVADAAAQAAVGGATQLEKSTYKLPITVVLVRRAVLKAAA